MHSPATTAALTLSLTGPFERQGTEAAEGVRRWAEMAGVRLTLVDDRGSTTAAARAYAAWINSKDLLIGPYASGLVRAVAPLVRDGGRLLWNHGGSADDLAQPGVVSLPAPASSYFDGVVDQAVARQIDRLVVVQGTGPFAQAVADGATTRASKRGLDVRAIEVSSVDAEDAAGAAFVLAGRFEHDVAVIRRLRRAGQTPALLGAVAAGIPAFAQELGEAAEGVLGPVQWWPNDHTPEIGPSGTDFASCYRRRTSREPSYPAAQAAAAGYLAHAAHQRGLQGEDLPQWATSTLLGDFALDADWRQVGHHVTTVHWQGGQMVPIATP
jgi:ABC-type branched-subunit amino acid transport system substrate-binding protein